MNSRTRSRSPASIGSNQSSRRWTAASASDCRVGDVVLLLVMAQSPPVCANAGIVWVSAPGDYAILNSNHTPDGTRRGRIVRLCKRFLLELASAIEADNRTDDHVAHLELLADTAGGAGGDH